MNAGGTLLTIGNQEEAHFSKVIDLWLLKISDQYDQHMILTNWDLLYLR